MEHGLSSQSGKIWIFWSAPFSVELLHDMGQVIHCRVSHSLFPDPVLVSYVYASCFMDVREDLWAALESFADSHDLPWIVGGDFNVVQAVSEISGGHPQPQGAIDAFNLALLDCGLEDAGFVGSPFTWTNGHTWRRLDRVVCNARWSAFFSVSRVSHLNRTASDHSPLLLSWDRDSIRGPSRFKFLHVWLKHPGLIDIVRHSWNAPVVGAGMRAFQQKLVRLKLCLKAWNKDVFGNVFSQVQQAEEEVAQKERLYDISGSADDRASFSEARARLQQALLREEIFMRQQSSVRWVREGDSNTRFFHAMIRKKRQLFHIHRIRDDSSSEWITDPSAVAASAVDFFRDLLSGDDGQFQQTDFDTIPTLVTAEDDAVLCREPDIDDVRRAVFSIDPESAPGPDGFCSKFYQVCWDIVGRDLLDAVLDYFRGSAMPRGFQSTFLILLPKKESPSSWIDFRPISLCNVSNKVITKLLVQRLSPILPRIISPSQSGFVPGRVIHDNVLLVQELAHDLNRRTRGHNVVLKLDMEKAYDRMSWPFILQMLRCFGFSERWISLIRRAVYGPWFSVLVSGAIHGYFQSERGLRQGDPISPCLFIIAAEFLSRGLAHLYSRYPSIRYRSAAPTDISHLSFADDIVIFANGSRCSLQRVMDFLRHYQAVSGQLISRTKSSFYIGNPASASCRTIVHSVTGFQWRQLPFIYLGCPIFTGCLKISYFDGMVRKVRERISGWANRLLSFGGKLILIRHVLSALPLHLFHVLRPPSTVIQSLERLFTRFLWGDSEGRRRIHWCRWPAVCFPVDEGGLGIRSFDDMAEAFEMKLWWRFRQQSSLWASFMKSKYCRSVHPGVIQFRYPASPLWRRLCEIRDTAGPHERWLVGQGECSFWYDCWLGSCPLYLFNPAAASSRPVSFYWQGTVWDRGKLEDILPSSIVEQILLVPISCAEPDLICWDLSPDGAFHLRTAWELVRCTRPRDEVYSIIWQRHIPSRVSFFLWRLLHSYLATDDALCSRGFHMVSRCLCGRAAETLRHLFLDCPRTRHIWGHYQRFLGLRQLDFLSPRALLLTWRLRAPSRDHLLVLLPCFILWQVWKARNAYRFHSQSFSIDAVIFQVGSDLRLAGSAFGFKPPQLRGALDSRFLEGLRVLVPPVRPVRVVAWMRPPPGVVKLTVDGCSRGNPGMAASGGILRDYRGVALAAFGSFLGHQPILYAELMAVCEGLELAARLGHSVLEVESDSATVVSWVHSQGPVRWDYSYLLRRACRLISSASIQVRHVLREATSAADFLANWACSHRSSRHFSSPQELPRGLLGILHTDAQSIPYVRR
ncbi:reverse transcriptase domain-containing protein [Citrus sinensis]|nr:reverse transcriptase domain-containing protein [Citrus sinensis]